MHPCSRRGWRVQRGKASLGSVFTDGGRCRTQAGKPIDSHKKQDNFCVKPLYLFPLQSTKKNPTPCKIALPKARGQPWLRWVRMKRN